MIYTVADFSSLPPRAMHLRMNVHDKIRWLMSRKGWKQAELASALKVSQPTVNRWLAGADPRGETRERIDDLFYSIVGEFETIDGVLDDVMEDMGLEAGSRRRKFGLRRCAAKVLLLSAKSRSSATLAPVAKSRRLLVRAQRQPMRLAIHRPEPSQEWCAADQCSRHMRMGRCYIGRPSFHRRRW